MELKWRDTVLCETFELRLLIFLWNAGWDLEPAGSAFLTCPINLSSESLGNHNWCAARNSLEQLRSEVKVGGQLLCGSPGTNLWIPFNSAVNSLSCRKYCTLIFINDVFNVKFELITCYWFPYKDIICYSKGLLWRNCGQMSIIYVKMHCSWQTFAPHHKDNHTS